MIKNLLNLNILNYYKWPIHLGTKVSERNRKNFTRGKKRKKNCLSHITLTVIAVINVLCVQSREDALPPKCNKLEKLWMILNICQINYDTKYFRFYNNAFNFSPSFVKEFCKRLIARKLEIYWWIVPV
jgi:hypothetical protein